ncbi:MAG: HNH endonuclease family protein, partial [Spiroplasma sp.]
KKIIPIFLTLSKKDYSEDEIESFMTGLVKYSILELNILQKSPGIFQYKIQEISDFILDSKKKISFQELIREVKSVKKDYENYNSEIFKNWGENLKNGDFNNITSNFVKTILLMFLQKEKYIKIDFNDIQTEHLFPQKPDIEWYKYDKWTKLKEDASERKKLINSIGNIILLESSVNNKIKNKYITEKKSEIETILNKSQILKNREWNEVNYDEFSPQKIIERTNFIINLLYERKILLD